MLLFKLIRKYRAIQKHALSVEPLRHLKSIVSGLDAVGKPGLPVHPATVAIDKYLITARAQAVSADLYSELINYSATAVTHCEQLRKNNYAVRSGCGANRCGAYRTALQKQRQFHRPQLR